MPRKLDYILTNDDGITAPGFTALRAAFRGRGASVIAAPSSQRSAVGHSITIHKPITCEDIPLSGAGHGWSIDGTPADCVKLALSELVPAPPRFVLSGINFGANLGVNVFYSGTVAAALEASLFGVPSFALSLCTKSAPRFADAGKIARRVVEEFSPFIAGTPVCLNVNIPNLPASKIRGIRFTHQARTPYVDQFHRRRDPRGRLYFWMDGDQVLARNGLGVRNEMTDIEAVRQGFVSITPLRLTMTCEATMDRLVGKRGPAPRSRRGRAPR